MKLKSDASPASGRSRLTPGNQLKMLGIMALSISALLLVSSCGPQKSKENKDQKPSQPETNQNDTAPKEQIPLVSSSPEPTPGTEPSPSPEPTPGTEPAMIRFSEIEAALTTECKSCHTTFAQPNLDTFADFNAARSSIRAALESKYMPPALTTGENPAEWTSAGAGLKVLQFFQQEGDLVE